jgi:hypothetical protein
MSKKYLDRDLEMFLIRFQQLKIESLYVLYDHK